MSLKEIQREKLLAVLKKESIRRGISLNPFDISDFLDSVFAIPSNSPGFPLANPVIQQPRIQFDADKYNSFLAECEFDIDVLFSFFNRSLIETRNNLIYNDVELRRISSSLENINTEVENFFKEADEPEKTNFSTVIKNVYFPECSVNSAYNSTGLFLDSGSNEIYLEPLINSYAVDMSFLENVTNSVSVSVATNKILRRKEPSSLKNLARTDATPWLFEMDVNDKIPEAAIRLDIPLPFLVKLNAIQIGGIPGKTYIVTVKISSAGDNWITVASEQILRGKANVFFPFTLVSKINIEIAASADITDNKSSFVIGLTYLKFMGFVFNKSGSMLINNIDLNINNRPILSVQLTANQDIPNGTETKYFVGLGSNSDTIISGVPGSNNVIDFSIARKLTSSNSKVLRTLDVKKTINSINYSSLKFESLGLLTTTGRTFIPKLSEVWLGQSVFKENYYEDFQIIQIEDAVVNFETNKESFIQIAHNVNGLGLHEDSTGKYLELLLPLSKNSRYTGTVDLDTDIKNLMKTTDEGVYKITFYNSKTPDKPTIINDRIVRIEDNKRVYISGTYAYDVVFSIDYNATITSEVVIKKGTVKLHKEFGAEGKKESNEVPVTLGKYQVNYNMNKLIPTDTTLTGRYYVNFEALFNVSKLKVYETFIYVPKLIPVLNLLGKIVVDQEGSEFAILSHQSKNEQIRLENVAEIKDFKEGWYSLTVVSKPYSSLPSAIRSILEIKDNPGIITELPEKVFSLTSTRGHITKLGLWMEPNKYVDREIMFNETRRIYPNAYSSVVIGDVLHFIAPDLGTSILKIEDEETCTVDLTYFPSNLYSEVNGKRVHSYLNIRIDMQNSYGLESTSTPLIKGLQLKVNYL